MRVRIKESSFCLRALRATLTSFRIGAARSTLPMSRQPSRRPSSCLATANPVCNREATGETLDLRELRCRCNLEYPFVYADGKPLDRPQQLCCALNQPGRPYRAARPVGPDLTSNRKQYETGANNRSDLQHRSPRLSNKAVSMKVDCSANSSIGMPR